MREKGSLYTAEIMESAEMTKMISRILLCVPCGLRGKQVQ